FVLALSISLLLLSFFFCYHWCCVLSDSPVCPNTYTLPLHDALPIYVAKLRGKERRRFRAAVRFVSQYAMTISDARETVIAYCETDRKSTRLNSSHVSISYAVFCLKKKRQVYSPSDHG